tara:strand:+ start:82 stop:777 length:696 start_codon:yes stop_codon:yes gene_type:complete
MKVDLFFCGDSFTHGAELEGLEKDQEKREKQRFSTLVSEKLGMTHDNVSRNGACNDWIVRNVVEWFETGNECDTAFIQFSNYRRWGWYDKQGEYMSMPQEKSHGDLFSKTGQIDADIKEETHNAYWEFIQSEPKSLDNYWKNKFFIKNYLKDKCKVHFLTLNYIPVGKNKYYRKNFWYNLSKNIEVSSLRMIVDRNFTEKYNDSDLTGSHPSTIGHQLIADHLLNIVKREN